MKLPIPIKTQLPQNRQSKNRLKWNCFTINHFYYKSEILLLLRNCFKTTCLFANLCLCTYLGEHNCLSYFNLRIIVFVIVVSGQNVSIRCGRSWVQIQRQPLNKRLVREMITWPKFSWSKLSFFSWLKVLMKVSYFITWSNFMRLFSWSKF